MSNGHPFSLPAGFAPLPPLICGPPRRRLPRSLFEKKSVFNRSQFTMEHGEWERESSEDDDYDNENDNVPGTRVYALRCCW